jgi:hypothetical protein
MTIRFQNPPKRERARRVLVHDYWAIADQLRERPGEWALCFPAARVAIAYSIRRGVRALPRDEFEMRTENNTSEPPRTCDIYLRYKPKQVRTGKQL